MNESEASILRDLLAARQVATLAVVVNGEPITGVLPFAIYPDFSIVVVRVSTLARHTAGLIQGHPVSLSLHRPENPGENPLQIPRVNLRGVVSLFARETGAYEKARRIYLDKYPESQMLFQLGDFLLFGLEITGGRFVAGFGRIFNLSPAALRTASVTPS